MTPQKQAEDTLDPRLRGLHRRRLLAWIVLAFEGIWPAIWPALGLAGLWLCLALLDVPQLLPAWLHLALLGLTSLGCLALLARGLWRVAWPDAAAGDRRIEAASGLRHRPLQVLADRPATPGAEKLWQAHRQRVLAQIDRLRVGWPHPGLARIDRKALRGGLIVALVASAVVAGPTAPDRLRRAFAPQLAARAIAAPMLLQAWITPPGYTDTPPIFLHPEGGAVTVPADSHLTLSLSGGDGAPSLSLGGQGLDLRRLDANSFQADANLTEGGRLALLRDNRPVAGWDLTVLADQPPMVGFSSPPSGTGGPAPQTRIPWQARHSYGVAALALELRLRDRPAAPPVILPIPLPSTAPKSAKGTRIFDLTPHPWAGLDVVARLVGRSVSGREGRSAELGFVLPAREFLHPIARALIELRRGLSLHPDDRARPLAELDAIARLSEVWDVDTGGYLVLSDIMGLLAQTREPAESLADAQDEMWQLALHLEDGAAERTAKALDAARENLRQALQPDPRGEPPDKAELDRRMRDVQEALRRHLEALAERARRDPDSNTYDPREHELDVRDMQRLAEAMRDAARQDHPDAARDRFAELDRMIEEMRTPRTEPGQMSRTERQRAQQRQKGKGDVSVLQDIIQREGHLLDTAQSRAEAAASPITPRLGPALRPPSPPTAAPDGAEARDAERAMQRALRRALGEVMQQYGDLMGEIPPPLGEADNAMRDAAAALANAQDQAAAGLEQKAIEALQKGGRQMGQQLAEKFGRGDQDSAGEQDGEDGQPGEMAGTQDGSGADEGDDANTWGPAGKGRPRRGQGSADRRAEGRRDPLGRAMGEGSTGADEGNDVKIPDEMELARTRAIQEELRRRAADRDRPQPELEYLDRLLRPF